MTSKSDSNLDSSFNQSKKAIRPNLLKLMPTGSGRKRNKFKLKSSESDARDRYLDDPAYTADVSHLAIPMRRNSGPESERRKSFSIIQSQFSTDSGKTSKHYNEYDESKVQKRKVYDKKKKKSTEMEKKMYQGRCESSSSDELEYSRRGQSLDRHLIKHQKKMHSSQHDINTTSLDHKKYKMYARKDFVSGASKSFQQKYHSSMNYGSDYKKSSSKNAGSRSRERFNAESMGMYHTDEMQRGGGNSSTTPDESKTKDSSRFQIGKRLLKGEIGIKSFNYYLLKEGLKSSKKSLFKHLSTNDERKSFENVSRSDENIYEEIFFVDKNKKKIISNPDCDLCIQECTRKNCDICRANELIGKRANEKSFRESEIATIDQSVNMKDLVQHRQNVLQYQSYNPNNPGVYKIETTPVAFTNDYNPIYQVPNKPLQQAQQQQQPQRQQIYQQQSYLNARNAKSSSSSDSIHQKNFARQHGQPTFNEDIPLSSERSDIHVPKIHKTDSKASIVSENISMRSSDNSNNYHKQAEMSDSSIGDSLFSYSAQRRFFGSSESCRFGYECRRCSYDGDKVSFSDTCRYDCRNCDCSSSYFSSDFDELNFSRNNSTRWSANMLQQDDEAGRKTKQYAQDFFKHVTNVKKKTQSQMIAESIPKDSSLSINRLNNQNLDSKMNVKKSEKTIPNGKSSLSSTSKSSSYTESPLHDQIENGDNNKKKGAVPKTNQSKKNEKIKIDNSDKSDANEVVSDQKRSSDELDEQKTGKSVKINNTDTKQNVVTKIEKVSPKESRPNQINVTENVDSAKRPEWLELEDDEVFEAAIKSVTSVGATNSSQINPISVPNDTKDTACAEQIESKQTTRTTPDKFAPTYPNGKECAVQAAPPPSTTTITSSSSSSSVLIQSPTQHQTRLFEPTASDVECKNNISMDQQQQQRFRPNDADASRNNVDTKIDAESDNVVPRTTEEKSKEEVVILSTEKSSNFSKTATISIISDVHVAGDTVNRNQPTETKKSPSTHTSPDIASASVAPLFDSNDLPDFPLPDLPVATKPQTTQKVPVAEYHHSLPTSYKTKQRSIDKLKQFPLQRTATDNMLSRKLQNRRESDQYLSFNDDMPKYLFGDRTIPSGPSQRGTRPDEKIFLNKSGYVQVNQRRADKSPVRIGRRHSKTNPQDDVRSSTFNRFNSLDRCENLSYHQPSHKFSKIEELISRDEARSINVTLKKFELDPRISALLNDRPGFLPIKRAADNDSPPPITPIISPPPAFQDSKSSKPKSSEMVSKIHLSVNNKLNSDKLITGTNKKVVNQSINCSNNNLNNSNNHTNNNNKGMVFSRSFEYDNREPRQYNEIFSKSFDYDFKTPFTEDKRNAKDKTKAFTTLTGVSPNYLTKKERSLENSRDNSPQHHQYLEPLPIVRQIKQKSHVRTTLSIRPEKFRSMDEEKGRSRRAQFSKTNIENSITGIGQGFRSFDTSMAINKRLNSCDSGARSDLSNDEIDSDNHLNGQRSNYLFSQSRHVQSVIKKQRSLTPDKSSDDQSQMSKRYINTDKRSINKNSSIESQGSVYLKSSSSSRSSILDRQRHEDNKFISSRSSSTSSFSGGEQEPMNFNRSRYRQPPQESQLSTGSRIRRSRSLQLTERSPSRSKQAFKNVLPNPPPNNKYTQPQRERPNKRSEQEQRSFEAEYNKYQYNSKLDFDKSRSFDDDYSTDQNRASKFINENRSLSNDRVFSSNTSNATAKPKQNMANYGTRLYDHEMMYDMARKVMDRSPIMEFNDRKRDPNRSREKSPSSSSNEHLMSHRSSSKAQNKDYFGPGDLPPNEIVYRSRLSPGTEVDVVHDYDMKYKSDVLDSELIKEAKLVTEFLYGNRTKAEILLNQRRKEQKQLNQRPGAMSSSSGSCTASSCDFWPHCGSTHNFVTDKKQHLTQSRSHDDLNLNDNTVLSVCDNDRYIGSNNLKTENQLSAKCSVNGRVVVGGGGGGGCDHVDDDDDGGGDDGCADDNRNNKTVIKITAKPPIYERLVPRTAATKCLLDEREMPITRERDGLKLEQTKGLRMRGSTGSDSGLSPDRFALRSPIFKKHSPRNGGTSMQEFCDSKLRSVSLPGIVCRDESTTDEDFRSFASFTITKSKNPMRAVSCPSIIENHLDQADQVTKVRQNEKDSMSRIPKPDDIQHANRSAGGVFQKLKNTFSNLKGKNADFAMADADAVYTFGPLKWRSSKERRKVKQLRRDKCNSGDSGIHVEHENDSESNENIPPMSIRRINSAKDQKIKEMKINRSDRKQLRYFKGKSASQPNGLNTYRDRYESDSLTSDNNFQEIVYAEVLYPFEPVGDQELALETGALVEVIRRDPGPWWWGQIKHDEIVATIIPNQPQGWFPKDFVRVIPPLPKTKLTDLEGEKMSVTKEDVVQLEFAEAYNHSIKTSPAKGSQSSAMIRDNVVKELLETEIKYVKLLTSLCNGFLNVLRQRDDIFSVDSISLIFANIEQIWQFQETFLDALRNGIQQKRIAETFIEFQSAFMVYSIYCNSYSRALMELESFSENEKALTILEDCRIAQNLPELPLSAHLLAPIQRLCRYPLHLSELVKFTPAKLEILKQQPSLIDITKSEAEMIDCKETLELALSAMKRVTEMVNEGKRHSEYLFRIQSRIDDFQGPAISLHSTRLFLQSDAIHMTPNIWNNTYTLFLFDHQIIYCKKDLLKRTQYIYKGRIFLDNCRILNLPDGKMFGVTLKNALRLFCATRNKWLDFCFRSSSSKLRFLNTLSAERQFCGQNLFISELAGEDDNGMLTDDDDNVVSDHVDYVDVRHDNVIVEPKVNNAATTSGIFKKSDTLPKKSRKLHKDMTATSFECHSNSLGRRRINNWFRKARSTSSTPSHSPTHQMIASNTSSSSSSTNTLGLNSIKPKQKKSSIFVSSSS